MLVLVVLSGCATLRSQVTRYAWITGLKPEKIERYEYLHSHPWPTVNKMIKESNIVCAREFDIDQMNYIF